MTTRHQLKTLSRYWDAVLAGQKTFEIRRNDRNFHVGDILELIRGDIGAGNVFVPDPLTVRGNVVDIEVRVTYVLTEATDGVMPGYVVLGFRRL